jgi:hypothetical protein
MDMVLGPPGVKTGIASVEVGSDLLEAPRRILDGVAVLGGRYKLDVKGVAPLVITLSLPNRRSEYWQLVNDVRSQLDLAIGSLTLGAMVLLMWNGVRLTIPTTSLLYTDGSGESLEKKVEGLIGRRLEGLSSGYPGLFDSAK